jgi:ABC-2 type transport system ATP-binding protein
MKSIPMNEWSAKEFMPPLKVESLRKSFDGRPAVASLSFAVEAGEVLGLLGPNGAGKTTTITCIAGLLRPDRGSIFIGGTNALGHGCRARMGLGLATQATALYGPLDAERNLRFFAALAGFSGPRLGETVSLAIERFQLEGLLGRPVERLSAGQKRLVHVAAAVVAEPPVVILDEATANLDVTARRLVTEAARDLSGNGSAILYSSHYMDEVEALCNRVLILDKGASIAEGRVAELVSKHGGGRVEFMIDNRLVAVETDDLKMALRSVKALDRVQAARVISPSLEAVFVALTGKQIDAEGFVTSGTSPNGSSPECGTF